LHSHEKSRRPLKPVRPLFGLPPPAVSFPQDGLSLSRLAVTTDPSKWSAELDLHQ